MNTENPINPNIIYWMQGDKYLKIVLSCPKYLCTLFTVFISNLLCCIGSVKVIDMWYMMHVIISSLLTIVFILPIYILIQFKFIQLYLIFLLVLCQYQKLAQFILPSIFNRHNKQQQKMQFPFPRAQHKQDNDTTTKQKQVVGKSYLDTLALKAIYCQLKSTSALEQPIDEAVKLGKEKWEKLLTCQETTKINETQLLIICGEIFINDQNEEMQEIDNWVCKVIQHIYGQLQEKGQEEEQVTQKKQESEYSLWSLESPKEQINIKKRNTQQKFNDKKEKYQKVIKSNDTQKYKQKKANNSKWSQELDSNLEELPFLLDISAIQNQENKGKQVMKGQNATELNTVSLGISNRQNNAPHGQPWNTHVQKVSNYLSTVLNFRSQLNLLMQQMKIKRPEFTRSRYMDRYYICVDVSISSEYTNYQNSRFLGYGWSANLKAAYEQACFIVLRDMYLKYSSLWSKFVSIKQQKGLK